MLLLLLLLLLVLTQVLVSIRISQLPSAVFHQAHPSFDHLTLDYV